MRQNKLYRITACLAIMVSVLTFSIAAKAELYVISNPEVKENSLSASNIKSIFTNKIPKWDDGTKINIIVLADRAYTKDFLKKYIHKTPSQFKTYWLKQVFTGKAIMYETAKSLDDLVKKVSETPGAVSFIDSSKPLDNVKTITIQ